MAVHQESVSGHDIMLTSQYPLNVQVKTEDYLQLLREKLDLEEQIAELVQGGYAACAWCHGLSARLRPKQIEFLEKCAGQVFVNT